MTASATSSTSQCSRLLLQIPGYDPYRDAEGYVFDKATALNVIRFFEKGLVHVKGKWAGSKIKLEVWQRSLLANLFGWKRPDGTRRYREAFIFVPRKNSKTTMAAGICNYLLFCDQEPGAEIYCAAAEREQASLLFDVAKQQVLRSKELSNVAHVYKYAITIEASGSSFKSISAEAGTKHGFNTHAAVIDELHAQPNRELVDVLRTSTGARLQPLIVYITTSDYEREGSICNEKYDYACMVRDGIVHDPAFLPVIYEASIKDDWTSPAVWRKANPNLNISISEEYIARECATAKASPEYENNFKRLHLNIRTEALNRWFSMDRWDACNTPLNLDKLKGKPCFAGLDLAATKDLTAFVLLFHEDDKYQVLPFFWLPEERVRELTRKGQQFYSKWARQGVLNTTAGKVTDYAVVRAKIKELGEQYNIREIAVDRWNATQIATDLTGDGFEMVAYGQGYASMSGPAKELEKIVLEENLVHGGHPVLRWQAANVSVVRDHAGNIKPTRESDSVKIDGIVATIMALGRAIVNGPPEESPYKNRGFRFL